MTDTLDRLKSALADRYEIEREIGQGGMANVYLSHDVKHDRKVALKVLRPELAAVIGAERFLKEISVTANLQHPHILQLTCGGGATKATDLAFSPTGVLIKANIGLLSGSGNCVFGTSIRRFGTSVR